MQTKTVPTKNRTKQAAAPTDRGQDQTRWLDADQQGIWRSFLGGTTVLFDQLDRDLRRSHDLSMGEYEILVRLSEAPGQTMRMADLASSVAQSRSRITHTIARLQKDGMVEREACSEDGRGVNANLTSHGLDTLRQASHTHVAGVRDYLVDLASPEELAAVGQLFERIVTRLEGTRF